MKKIEYNLNQQQADGIFNLFIENKHFFRYKEYKDRCPHFFLDEHNIVFILQPNYVRIWVRDSTKYYTMEEFISIVPNDLRKIIIYNLDLFLEDKT